MSHYKCSVCGSIVTDAAGLIWHLRNRHACMVGRTFTYPITCGQDGCMRTFRYSYALVRHLESIHHVENNSGDDIDELNGDK